MNKKCPFGKCEKCIWFREWRFDDLTTGQHKLEEKCSIEILLDEIPRIRGSIDGLQGGVNEARNRSMEAKQTIHNYLEASIQGFKKLSETIMMRKAVTDGSNKDN